MDEHVGKTLKILAKVCMWIEWIAGLVIGLKFVDLDEIGLGILIMVGGVIVGWITNIITYAFGHLVETNQEISEYCDYMMREHIAQKIANEDLDDDDDELSEGDNIM